MKKLIYIFLLMLFIYTAEATEKTPWNSAYQKILIEKIAKEIPALSTYPSLEFPNLDFEQILKKYPHRKVLIFGYGSLINVQSAAESVSKEALQTMRPAIAFGLKRIFNYKVDDASFWGKNQPKNEGAMLNLEPTTTYNHMINGVVMKISPKDLAQLIDRETGYDLVPILVADWDEVVAEDHTVQIKIAYTFFVPDELREGVDYTQTKYYPVRGYLKATREGAAVFGPKFLHFWNATTYLGDGTTTIDHWDEKTFSGILDTREPGS